MMWMMGYNDGGEFNTIQDPFSGLKLRPLIPRPATAAAASTSLTRIRGSDLLATNHHLASATATEQNKRDHMNTQQVVVSSRWNPTPEQLQTLEELYRRGTRTPSAEQIQHITAQLRRYGKIEGKNVFYWFQNHKARERQKRRRQLESLSDEPQNQIANTHNREKTELPPGANRTVFEVEQTKNWASHINSSTVAEKIGNRQEDGEAERKADDDNAELQLRRNATWRTMASSPTNNNLHINNSSSVTSTNPNHQDFLTIFSDIYTTPLHIDHFAPTAAAQTLQLFPLQSNMNHDHDDEVEEEEESGAVRNTAAYHVTTTPCQFFEFLPMKN